MKKQKMVELEESEIEMLKGAVACNISELRVADYPVDVDYVVSLKKMFLKLSSLESKQSYRDFLLNSEKDVDFKG